MKHLTSINEQIYTKSAVIDSALSRIIPTLVKSAATKYRAGGISDIRGEFLEQIYRLYTSYTSFDFDTNTRDWLQDYTVDMPNFKLISATSDRCDVSLLTFIMADIRKQISAIGLVSKQNSIASAAVHCHWANTMLLYSYYEYMCKLYILLRMHHTETVVMTAFNPVIGRFISKFVNNNPEILIMFLESNAIPYLKYNGENILIYKSMLMSPTTTLSASASACRAGVIQYLGRIISANKLKTKVMSRCSIFKAIISSNRSRVALQTKKAK